MKATNIYRKILRSSLVIFGVAAFIFLGTGFLNGEAVQADEQTDCEGKSATIYVMYGVFVGGS